MPTLSALHWFVSALMYHLEAATEQLLIPNCCLSRPAFQPFRIAQLEWNPTTIGGLSLAFWRYYSSGQQSVGKQITARKTRSNSRRQRRSNSRPQKTSRRMCHKQTQAQWLVYIFFDASSSSCTAVRPPDWHRGACTAEHKGSARWGRSSQGPLRESLLQQGLLLW